MAQGPAVAALDGAPRGAGLRQGRREWKGQRKGRSRTPHQTVPRGSGQSDGAAPTNGNCPVTNTHFHSITSGIRPMAVGSSRC